MNNLIPRVVWLDIRLMYIIPVASMVHQDFSLSTKMDFPDWVVRTRNLENHIINGAHEGKGWKGASRHGTAVHWLKVCAKQL
jgi:hypothetical protein